MTDGLPVNPKIRPPWAMRNRADVKAMLCEFRERGMESLRLYEPLPFQDAYHQSRYRETVLMKATRAGGPLPIATPVLTPKGWTPIGELSVGDAVVGGDGFPCQVRKVIRHGVLPVFRMTFDDGTSAVCSEDHHWKCKLTRGERFRWKNANCENTWGVYSLSRIRQHGGDQPEKMSRAVIPTCCVQHPRRNFDIDPYVIGVLLGDGHVTQSAGFTSFDQQIVDEVKSLLPRRCHVVAKQRGRHSIVYEDGQKLPRNTNRQRGKHWHPVLDPLRELGVSGQTCYSKRIPSEYMAGDVEQRLSLLQGLMDTDGHACEKGACQFSSVSPGLVQDVIVLVQSLGGKAWARWSKFRPNEQPCARVYVWLQTMCPFRLERKAERWANRKMSHTNGRVLRTIAPEGEAECCCIEVGSPDHTFVINDFIVTHNSVAGFVEDARAALNCDPYKKYPAKNGVIVCVGWGEGHIGRVIHRLLFRPGAFDIIQDERTKEWRVFRPWGRDDEVAEKTGKPGDAGREDESMPAPPLIPKRRIKGKIAWLKASHRIFSRVDLDTGWSIYAANSAGDPEQFMGFDVNLYHIDEDVDRPGWYTEATSRTQRVGGFLRWTAMPHGKNQEMVDLVARAKEQEGRPDQIAKLLTASMFDNPYLPRKAMEENKRIWLAMGEDVYRQRALGELTTDSVRMYPTFSKSVHSYMEMPASSDVKKILLDRNGVPPDTWCRYAITDPGHAICAVLFVAVPPPDLGDHIYFYDELYIGQSSASIYGESVARKVGHNAFQSFIIDAHGGRLTDFGTGMTPREQYSIELAKRGIRSVETGSDFLSGSDIIEGRTNALREWLSIRRDGSTRLIVNPHSCHNLCTEMMNLTKKFIDQGGRKFVTDEKNPRQPSHLTDCAEYAAAHGCRYVAPPKSVSNKTWVERMLETEKARKARFRVMQGYGGDDAIVLGPTGADA